MGRFGGEALEPHWWVNGEWERGAAMKLSIDTRKCWRSYQLLSKAVKRESSAALIVANLGETGKTNAQVVIECQVFMRHALN